MGILLPKEALNKLKVGKRDTLYLVENTKWFTLTPYQEDSESQIRAAEKVLKRCRHAFRELAK